MTDQLTLAYNDPIAGRSRASDPVSSQAAARTCNAESQRAPSEHEKYPVPLTVGADVEARFWSKVTRSDGCWLWTGYRNRQGYGVASTGHSMRLAHRIASPLTIGPIPRGLALDHVCCNTSCVNPAHLEPVTTGENLRRWRERNTLCPRGHDRGTSGECLVCKNERHKQYTASGRFVASSDRHGQAWLYKHGCRCEACKSAYSAAQRKWRKPASNRRVEPVSLFVHGTPHGFDRGMCRCDACRSAYSEYTRAGRERRKAKGKR